MILCGFSVRGLSEVTMIRSAKSSATRAILGRFVRSLSPPQPKTTMVRPSLTASSERRTLASASSVWA